MQKSQLRRLALDHARGELSHDDYVRERSELIDAIAGGNLAIEREVPRPASSTAVETIASKPTLVAEATPQQGGGSLVYIVIGAIVLATVVYLIWPIIDSPSTPIVDRTPEKAKVPAPPAIPASQRLVQNFVDENNWNESSTTSFREQWQALSETERNEARVAPWFLTLTTALRQEINARRALAGLSGGEADRVEGQRLVAFAGALGIEGTFPSFAKPVSADGLTTTAITADLAQGEANGDASNTDPPIATAPPAPAPESTPQPTSGPKPTSTASPGSSETTKTSTRDNLTKTDADWLTQQPSSDYTLQLFVVRDLSEIRKLAARHTDANLHVVRTGDTYRLLQGRYKSVAEAKAAHATLPVGLRLDQPDIIVRTLADLRAMDASEIVSRPYTLQLFVFSDSNNADKLVSEFEEVGLRAVLTEPDGKHRVLWGAFASVRAAREAGTTLPGKLLAKVGTPVVKRITDPAGAAVTP